jgi:hypothetical protein
MNPKAIRIAVGKYPRIKDIMERLASIEKRLANLRTNTA